MATKAIEKTPHRKKSDRQQGLSHVVKTKSGIHCAGFLLVVAKTFCANVKGSGIPQVLDTIDLATPKHEDKASCLLSLRIAATKSFLAV